MSDNSEQKEFKLDMFHMHEAIDRIHTVEIMVDELLVNHPAVTTFPSVESKIKLAQELLIEAYQELGSIDIELHEAGHNPADKQ